ncbi:MAG: hypothetical protein LBE02_01805 [Spirochaetaceae bacterium]|jgi:opacity protein-like surface antigen|nr:hypothetical protein [Spirochaetaceae bacterium]
MKKIIALAALVFAAGLAFAQEDAAPAEEKPEKFDLEVTVGFPIHWTNADHRDSGLFYEDKTVTANTALGLSLLFNFTRKLGFTLDTDFFFGGKIMGFASNNSNYNSLFGANVLLGPVIYLYNGNFLRIPLAFGAHLYYFSDDLWEPAIAGDGDWIKRQDLQIGPGAYLGIQFHFNKNIYIFSRTSVAVDVFRWYKANTTIAGSSNSDTDIEFAFGWTVTPVIGIGVKF